MRIRASLIIHVHIAYNYLPEIYHRLQPTSNLVCINISLVTQEVRVYALGISIFSGKKLTESNLEGTQ